MRISDWSSDVCSSDLHGLLRSGLLSRPGAVQHAEASSLIPSPRFGMCGDCLLDSQRLAPFCGAGAELCGPSAPAGALSSALFPDPPTSRMGQPEGRAVPRVEPRPPVCRAAQFVCEKCP